MYYISLAESFNPSALEPGVEYSKMFISWMNINLVNQSIKLGLEFGDVVSGVEVKGTYSQTMVRRLQNEDWLGFVSLTSDDSGEYYVEKQQEYLLNELVDNNVVSGVVEYQQIQI